MLLDNLPQILADKRRRVPVPKVLSTMNISKGFARWTEMAKTLAPEMEKVGAKMLWAGTNPDETQVFVLMELQDMSQMQTFGEREDIAKARAEAGADVASTTVISPIGEIYWP
jgi:hypothetical protein